MTCEKIRLLLVEDDQVDQMAFERYVRSNDLPYDYDIAGSVAETRAMVKSIDFDIIILDYSLGDGTAFELFDLFKDIPVIMTTGSGNEEIAVEAMKKGAWDYLIKDPAGNYLKMVPSTIGLALKRRQNENELRQYQGKLESLVKKRTANLQAQIHERKRAEKALRESEALKNTIIESSQDCIKLLDLKGNLVFMNKGGQKKLEITDISPFLNKCWIDFWTGEDNINARAAVETAVKGGIGNFQGLSPTQTGTPKWWDVVITPILNATGEVTQIMAVSRDITEHKQMEESLRQALKMESVGRLAGGVAHDYNNALSVIMGYTELALAEIDPATPLHADLTEVLKAGRHAADITRQLLAFARKQTIAPRVLDLNDNIETMLKMLRRLIGENIDLVWLPGTGLGAVKMDPSQIDQILANLCINARDAIAQVGKVTIETENITFDNAYCKDHHGFVPGHFIMLAVSDNGCGMDKTVLDSIFEPFFTTKGANQGTGLGLATVYGIVKQNSGFINVYSEPGKGTTFKIYLPRHEGEPCEIQQDRLEEMPTSQGETILLVEDDLSILKLVEKTIKTLGYTVLAADSPAAALDLAQQHTGKIHLLITDVIMPQMNGRQLSEQLNGLYPDLKSLFMSGYTANAIAHHGVLDKGMSFIQKPFSKKDLAEMIRKTVDDL